MKSIYTQTSGRAAGREVCYCRQCDWRFLRTPERLDICIHCGQNVETTMRRWQARERERLADAPRVADETFNGTYRGALSGAIYRVSAHPANWEKRIIRHVATGEEWPHTNLDVRHMIDSRILERIPESPMA